MIPRIRNSNGHGNRSSDSRAAEKQGDADDVAVMTNDEGIRGHVVFVTSIVIITTIILVIVIFIDYCV